MDERADIDVATLTAQLTERREELLRLAGAGEEEQAPVELDQSRIGRLSRMDALQGQAMAKEIARRRTVELNRIAAALSRVEEGEYGFCLSCGEPIAAKRLDLDPTVPNCIDCAQQQERH
jgi:DnaK suppressor protein